MLVKIELFSALLHCVVDHVGSIFGVEVVSNHHAMQFNNPENHECMFTTTKISNLTWHYGFKYKISSE